MELLHVAVSYCKITIASQLDEQIYLNENYMANKFASKNKSI